MISRLKLDDFRNYRKRTVTLEPGINVVIGDNGRGKTNLLEALFFLLQGSSMRAGDAGELIRDGAEEAVIEGVLYKDREIKLRNVISREGEVKGRREMRDIRAVSFQPDDIWMVKGGPEVRRRYLDEVIVDTKKGYREVLREYQRTIRQRNEALKAVRKGQKEREFVRSWNPLLYRSGRSIVEERKNTMRRLQGEMTALGDRWGKGKTEIKYYTSMGDDIGDEKRTMERIQKMEDAEIRRGASLIGPHRDEILLFLSGRNVRRECSQGEQKLVTIMWRLAQAKLIQEGTGRSTLLLMDDCLSELDEANRKTIMRELGEWDQVLLTTTDDDEVFRGTHKVWLQGEEG